MKTYTPTIGIEVHAELKTISKMFCGCKNDPHGSEPNANICPVCLAHPGTLPTVNHEAVTNMMMVGTAVGGSLATYSEFDRKNYFYPDIPKAYQLSQYAYPFVEGGELAGVELTRIHLEEDTARSTHDQSEGSLVDFNRAGVPLMELVTEPVIHDSETAVQFAKELQLLLRTLGVSDANMEKGEMRVEANVSVSTDKTLGTKAEVKNINSFKAVGQAIEFEIKRQVALIEAGEQVVQETRGWDEDRSKTITQRIKESADDYRYFPDPDIPKIHTSKIIENSKSRLDEIPSKIPKYFRDIYSDLGIPSDLAEIIVADPRRNTFFTKAVAELSPDHKNASKLAANYFTSDISSIVEERCLDLEAASPATFAGLVLAVAEAKISSRVAKDLLFEVVFEGSDVLQLAEKRGLLQTSDTSSLSPIINTVIADNPSVVAEYRDGKEVALKFLLGQVMKLTRGAANPVVVEELLIKSLVKE